MAESPPMTAEAQARRASVQKRLTALEEELARLRRELTTLGVEQRLPGLYLTVEVAGAAALLPADAVLEVVRLVAIEPLPVAAPHVVGTMLYRGIPAVVVDLALMLGSRRTPELDAHLVICGGTRTVGLLVDRVRDLVESPLLVGRRGTGLALGCHRVDGGPVSDPRWRPAAAAYLGHPGRPGGFVREPGREEVLDEAILGRLEYVLKAACGMVLAPVVRRSLGTALTRAAESQQLPVPDFLHRVLARDTLAVEAFLGYAVIGETYFFRHPEHLRELGRLASSSSGPFHVWSAGCASGEEPYSIVMALLAAGVSSERIRVLGTDVSGRALARARQATYTPWSVRRMEPELERRFRLAHDDTITVPPEVRARVDFLRHNLVTDGPPRLGLQAVFCRNVLIYFPPELIPGVLERLVLALEPGGWLFLAPAEVPFAHGLGLVEREVEGLTVLRRPLPGEAPPARIARPVSLRLVPGTSKPPLKARSHHAPEPVSAPASELRPPADPEMPTPLERARAAARAGQYDLAEELARVAARELSPEAYLLLAMVSEGRGDVPGAVAAVRKALYLEPTLAIAHAMLVALYGKLGQPEEAERARRNALRALEGLDDEQVLRGMEAVTAGGLRRALVPRAKMEKSGAQ